MERIGEIEVVRELKYLGIVINDNTRCFRKHKEEKIKQLSKKNGKYDLLSDA